MFSKSCVSPSQAWLECLFSACPQLGINKNKFRHVPCFGTCPWKYLEFYFPIPWSLPIEFFNLNNFFSFWRRGRVGEQLVLSYWQHRERWKVLSLGSVWLSQRAAGFSASRNWDSPSPWPLGTEQCCAVGRTGLGFGRAGKLQITPKYPLNTMADQLLLQAWKPKPDIPYTPRFVALFL